MSIEKRGDKYRVVVYLERDADGRYPRIVKQVDTHNEALRLQGELLRQRDRGLSVDASKMTVASWLRYWLENVAAHRLAPSTLARYGRIVEQHLAPAFAAVTLAKLTPLQVERYELRALKQPQKPKSRGTVAGHGKPQEALPPLSPTTVRQHLAVLHKALQDAVSRKIVPDNPADGIDMPTPRPFTAHTVARSGSASCWTRRVALGYSSRRCWRSAVGCASAR